MVTDKSVSETRLKLTSLQDELDVEDVVAVTRRKKRALALMRWELYEGLISTLEILADEELMQSVRAGLDDLREGRVVSLEEFE